MVSGTAAIRRRSLSNRWATARVRVWSRCPVVFITSRCSVAVRSNSVASRRLKRTTIATMATSEAAAAARKVAVPR